MGNQISREAHYNGILTPGGVRYTLLGYYIVYKSETLGLDSEASERFCSYLFASIASWKFFIRLGPANIGVVIPN